MTDKVERDGEPQPGRGGFNPVAFAVAALLRFRPLVVATLGLGLLFGLFRALTTPNEYRSLGKLFVRPGIRETITPESAFSGAGERAATAGTREAVQNELQVLSAPQLYEKVVADLGADFLLAPYNPATESGGQAWHTRWFHAFQTWWFAAAGGSVQGEAGGDRNSLAAEMLAQNVVIYPEAGTSVITVTYVSHSAAMAQTVVNAVLKAAKDVHKEVFDTLSSLGAIEEELKSAEGIARTAEQLLREFRVEKSIYEFETQRDALLTNLGELDRQIDAVDVDMDRRKAEREWTMNLLQQEPMDRISPESAAPSFNSEYTALTAFKRQLQLLELNLPIDRNTMSPEGFEARKAAISKLIAETDAKLQSETLTVRPPPMREPNPDHVRLANALDDLDVALKGMVAQRAQLETFRTTMRQRLGAFEAMSPALRTLELDARQKRATADTLANGVTELKTVQRLNQLNISNVQVMHAGTYERSKIGPRRGQQVLFGGFGGALLGIALAVLLALRDPTIRNRHDLLRLGVPADGLVVSQPLEPAAAGTASDPFADARHEIAHAWASVTYDHRSRTGLKVAFVPCGGGADAGRATATMAMGLAIHGGERAIYVKCTEGPDWLSRRLGLRPGRGWTEVLRGDLDLEAAVVTTTVPGLDYLPLGMAANTTPHPMAGPAFSELLDRLCANHRFVVVELPDLEAQPAGRSVLGVVDGAELVVAAGGSAKEFVREAIAALRSSGARLVGAILQPAAPGAAAPPAAAD